jgi:hypothetical protein
MYFTILRKTPAIILILQSAKLRNTLGIALTLMIFWWRCNKLITYNPRNFHT